jgi:uncharacterized protein (TIGR00645 family)
MREMEALIERMLLASRWLLVVFYGGLAVGLALYAVSFIGKLVKVATNVLVYDDADMILAMLALIDAALVASLIVMVMISSYENFVSRFDTGQSELAWLGKLDAGSLKVKVASAIVAISSIHLLQIFMDADQYANDKLLWYTIIHMAFVASAFFLTYIDRLTALAKER